MKKDFIIDNTLPNPVKLTMPNSYETKLLMPGVQTLEVRYCEEYKENPDKIFRDFLLAYAFIVAVSDIEKVDEEEVGVEEVEVKEVEVNKVEAKNVEVALTRKALWMMDENAVNNLAEEKGIEFGRIKALDSKRWKIVSELALPEDVTE